MLKLEKKVQQILTTTRLIPPEQPVVVAVSGGADSMALLHVLARLRPFTRSTLVAAWIDHGLRPGETEEERRLVRHSAEQLRLLFAEREVDVRKHARQQGLSLEHAARELRYRALRDIASLHQAAAIAMAHTADDQAEEVLIRLIRGSGRKGLSGMRMRSGDLIRPLLTTSRRGIMAYLLEKGIRFCHDSSNNDLRFLRNRIRHRLLPFLENEFGRGIRQSLLKSADNLAVDESLLEEMTGQAWRQVIGRHKEGQEYILRRDPFRSIHPALQRRICERLLWALGAGASYQHILAIREMAIHGETGKELDLSRGLRMVVRRHDLRFSFPRGPRPWRGQGHE